MPSPGPGPSLSPDSSRAHGKAYVDALLADDNDDTPQQRAQPPCQLGSASTRTDHAAHSLPQILDALQIWASVEGGKRTILENLHILHDHLLSSTSSSQDDDAAEEDSDESLISVRDFTAQAILPGSAFAERSPFDSDETKKKLDEHDPRIYHDLVRTGLSILCLLNFTRPSVAKGTQILPYLRCAYAFADPEDAWCNDEIFKLAEILRADLFTGHDQALLSDAATTILEQEIKPAFKGSKNPAITGQGRKAIDPIPVLAQEYKMQESVPWKHTQVYLPTLLQSIIRHSDKLDAAFIERHWHLLIPPLLGLIDDSAIGAKVKGCTILHLLLDKVPIALLDRTSLRPVFESAVMPCLMYLPTLTDENSSLRLLRAAYPSLIRLANSWDVGEPSPSARSMCLDRIMRKGLLTGYAHAGDHVRIAKMLCEQMERMIQEMGIDVVKHLKHIVPILTSNLAAHLAPAFPPLILTSLQTMQTLMLVTWPRLGLYHGEILRGVTMLWYNLKAKEPLAQDLKRVQEGTQEIMRVLLGGLGPDLDRKEIEKLTETNPMLQELFAT